MKRLVKKSIKSAKEGKPCNHRGCLAHVSHPCEGCGRIAGSGEYKPPVNIFKDI